MTTIFFSVISFLFLEALKIFQILIYKILSHIYWNSIHGIISFDVYNQKISADATELFDLFFQQQNFTFFF